MAVAVYKYFDTRKTSRIGIYIGGNARGVVYVKDCKSGEVLAKININVSKYKKKFYTEFNGGNERQGISFTFDGKGKFDFYKFMLR
jgi:hypothetical protein